MTRYLLDTNHAGTLLRDEQAPLWGFGRIRAELRKAARPIPMFDILIAAIARANGLTVVTADAHFTAVTGLKTENWLVAP